MRFYFRMIIIVIKRIKYIIYKQKHVYKTINFVDFFSKLPKNLNGNNTYKNNNKMEIASCQLLGVININKFSHLADK